MPHLGDKLKIFRKGRNWNQAEMADFIGIGARTYQGIEITGIVKKSDVLRKIEAKTNVHTQNSATQDSTSNEPGEQYFTKSIKMVKVPEDFFQLLINKTAANSAALKVVIAKVKKLESLVIKIPFDKVSLDFDRDAEVELKSVLDQLQQ